MASNANSNREKRNEKNEKIYDFLREYAKTAGLIGVFVGIVFDCITPSLDEQPYLCTVLSIFSSLFITMGATLLSVALINVIYEKWRDDEMMKTIKDSDKALGKAINDIPKFVTEEITSSVTQISERVTSKIYPSVPCKIFPPGRQEKDPIVRYLIDSIKESDGKYYYTGIEMSTMAEAIKELKYRLNKAYFLIPNPKTCERLTENDKKSMLDSIQKLIDVWESTKQMRLEFVLLEYIPPFHIHKTSKDCWFAFLDIGTKDDLQRQKYPATYQYSKNKDKSEDNYEMYHTIADTIDKLYDRHSNGIDSEIVLFEHEHPIRDGKAGRKNTKANITRKRKGESLEEAINKEDFITLFTNEDSHE